MIVDVRGISFILKELLAATRVLDAWGTQQKKILAWTAAIHFLVSLL
jgi:hypothetical protein